MNDEIAKSDPREDALASHLRSLEESLLEPEVRRDQARVSALLADDFLEFGSSGRVWTRAEILDLLATESYTRPEIVDFACRRIADGVAIMTYRSIRTDPATGEQTETLRISLWAQKSGAWQVRFHQGTRVEGTKVGKGS